MENRPAFMSPELFAEMRAKYPKFYEPWKEDEVERVKQLFEEGQSMEDISKDIQRTPKSVRMKLKALGLYTPVSVARPWTSEDEETLKDMYRDGVSFDDMATQLDRSPKAIVARLVRLRMNLFPAKG